MKALGAELAHEQEELEQQLSDARARLAAHQTEEERRRHIQDARDRLAKDWEALSFADLQSAIRQVVDRIEVDGAECRLYVRP